MWWCVSGTLCVDVLCRCVASDKCHILHLLGVVPLPSASSWSVCKGWRVCGRLWRRVQRDIGGRVCTSHQTTQRLVDSSTRWCAGVRLSHTTWYEYALSYVWVSMPCYMWLCTHHVHVQWCGQLPDIQSQYQAVQGETVQC